RVQSVEGLEKTLLDLTKDRLNYRMKHSTGQLRQTHWLKEVARDIARVKTVLGEKERAEQDK
ncbi:MAG: 50S ribosomal protein L29, partial [Pseudomonadales bacterium]|nr:50S ribosomal protein L29 [Pseudomonadales bacterium]